IVETFAIADSRPANWLTLTATAPVIPAPRPVNACPTVLISESRDFTCSENDLSPSLDLAASSIDVAMSFAESPTFSKTAEALSDALILTSRVLDAINEPSCPAGTLQG